MKKYFKGILSFVITIMIFIPFVRVNALEYDPTQNPVVGLTVKSDGTISWQKTLDAYGIWVKHEGNNYNTSLINANSKSVNTVNLIELIEEKCIGLAYGCPLVDGNPTKTGKFIVLIKEDVGLKTITNTEFTVTYDGTKLSGTIVEPIDSNILKGDFDGNDKIDLDDIITQIRIFLGIKVPTNDEVLMADINEDDKIDLDDIIALIRIFLNIS